MHLKLGTKINLLFLTIILLFSSIIGVLVNGQIRDGIKEFAVEKAKSDLNLASSYINAAYPGEWHIQNEQLYKGDTLINNNFDIVDKIGEDSAGTVTIFQEDTRITTNVLIDGTRAVGTKVSDTVAEAVLHKKETYYGEADVAGNLYQAAYRPLLNEKQEVIGILYIGASQSIIDSIVSTILKSFLIVLVAIVLLAIAVITWFTQKIRKRLQNVTNVLEQAGHGDFTQALIDHTGDELSNVSTSFNQMTTNIKELVHEITNHSNEVADASQRLLTNTQETTNSTKDVATSIHSIAENVNYQQQMIEQSVVAINDVTNSIAHISEHAINVADVSLTSMQQASTGQIIIDKVITQMSTIYTSNAETNEVIRQLESRSIEIGKITDAITAISDQTNLLALNAAIESARAGEHGKGFAVVANEVRKLAEQSLSSAGLISSIVEAIQLDTKKVAELMGHTHEEIEQGIIVVKETGSTFTDISQAIQSANKQIQELSAISEEMTASMQEINASFEEVSQLAKATADDATLISGVTEEQLALAEQVTVSAETLSTNSNDLHQVVQQRFIIH